MIYRFNKEVYKEFLFNKGDFKIFNIDNYYFVWISKYLQLFKIQNNSILEFFKIAEYDKKIINSILSPKEIIETRKLIDNIIKSGKIFIGDKFINNNNLENLNSLVLNIAGINCNLKCKYCFIYTDQSYKPTNMNNDNIKKIFEFLISTNPNPFNDTYYITLFGGEPFLNSKIISFLLIYSKFLEKKLNKKFIFSATTNGTVVSKPIIEMFKNNKGSIIISLDGPKEIHDKNRPFHNGRGSFNKIMENIKVYDKYKFNYMLRATISPDNKKILDIIKYFENLGKNYYFDIELNTKYNKNKLLKFDNEIFDSLSNQYKEIMDFFFNKIKNDENIFCQNIYRNLTVLHYQKGNIINCSYGTSILSINSDGTIYSCLTLTNDKENSIGTIDEGIDKIKLKEMIAPLVDDINNCIHCWCKYLCAGYCFANKIISNKSIYSCMDDKCNFTKMLYENYINLYIKINLINPSFLKKLNYN